MAAFLPQAPPQRVASASAPAFVSSVRTQAPARVQDARIVAARAYDRPHWFPGNEHPSYLDGSLPGDYGYDPLGLSSDPDVLKWMVQAELVNARWAMLGIVGMLVPSIAAKTGSGDFPEWYDAGKVFADKHPEFPFGTLLMIEFILMGWAEMKRYYDWKKPGSQGDGSFLGVTEEFAGAGNGYPGGRFFDPFGLAKGSPEKLREYKVKELANGRLAMLACLGYYAQYAATGKGPVDNLVDHLQDPYSTTFTSNHVSVPFIG